MKIVRHPNIVRLHEVCFSGCEEPFFVNCFMKSRICNSVSGWSWQVLSSRTKIYIILEFVSGGELYDKIVSFLLHLNEQFYFFKVDLGCSEKRS